MRWNWGMKERDEGRKIEGSEKFHKKKSFLIFFSPSYLLSFLGSEIGIKTNKMFVVGKIHKNIIHESVLKVLLICEGKTPREIQSCVI